MSDCTPEQKKLVEEILTIKHTDYYRVLKVDKSANEIEIKKSYRKLAIKLHPDKNKHPKASEAFKVIAKAFEILGDDSKRKIYDMTGSDPDSRGNMGGGAGMGGGMGNMGGFPGFHGFQGFPQAAGGGGSPLNEDIFNMLFGMGGMGGNGFSFQFGGNGFPNNGYYYTNNAGMNARRRAAQQQHQQRQNARRGANGNGTPSELPWSQYIIQFLPLLIILISIIINSLSGGSSSNEGYNRNVREFSGRVPKYSFEPSGLLSEERTTPKYSLKYYLEKKTIDNFKGRKNPAKELNGLDKFVENQYVDRVSLGCLRERRTKESIIEQAQGIFFNDWERIDQANNMAMPNCERLEELQKRLL